MKYLIPILSFLLFTTALHAQPARLVMVAHKNYGEAIADTTWLKYKAGNMATGNFDDMYEGRLLYDTMIEHVRGRYVHTTTVKYNKHGKIESTSTVGLSTDKRMEEEGRSYFTYDADGNCLQQLELHKSWHSSKWDTALLRSWMYRDGHMVVAADSSDPVEGGSLFLYNYDAAGRQISAVWRRRFGGVWRTATKDTYRYDTAGNMVTHTRWGWNDTGYVRLQQRECIYAGMQCIREEQLRSRDTGYHPRPDRYSVKMYDANDRLIRDSSCGYIFPDPIITTRIYTYNAHGYNDTMMSYITGLDVLIAATVYNTHGWVENWKQHRKNDYVGETYFYEPVPIPPLPQSKNISIALPLTQVRDVLKVDVKTKTKQPYTITVHDATGKQTGEWKGQGSTRHTIRATDWLPGSYTLTVSNGTDSTAQYFTVHRGW